MTEDALIGRRLGNYELQRFLGRGGMARVYYAWDEPLARPVAIKIIDINWQGNERYAERFVQEARAVASWRHEHIIQVYAAGQEGDLYFFAMEYVNGRNLEQLLTHYAERGELMPHDDVLRIGHAVASALDYAHSKQVIHRDVKPSNVMVDVDGRVVLTDFGLALDTKQGSVGEILGTPHYISPEQAMNSATVVPASDIYSLGVMLFEMLTGQVPFDDESSMSLALKHLTESPPRPQTINPNLNDTTAAVLLRALDKEPMGRYGSGAALMSALNAALPTSTAAGAASLPPLPPAPVATHTVAARPLSRLSVAESMRLSAPMAPLPAMQAAAVAETPSPPVAEPPAQGRSCVGRLLMFLIGGVLLLTAVGSALWWVVPGGRDLPAVQQVAALVGMSMPTNTPMPTATVAVPTDTAVPPTVPPTETAQPTATETPLLPTATQTQMPTETAQPTATSEPPTATPVEAIPATATELPTATAQPTETVLPTATVEPSPTLFPTATSPLTITRELDGMVMMPIPATTFLMGASDDDSAAQADERPLHEVSLSAYYIDQYEVTVSQYVTFLNTLPPQDGVAAYVGGCDGYTCLSTRFETLNSHVVDAGTMWVPLDGFADHPVTNVSWYGAAAYCAWAEARLPTEAEWELAARGENGRLYPWGDDDPTTNEAVFNGNFASLTAVGSLPDGVSPFGLYQMGGNVWEWVEDGYDEAYYADSATIDPQGPTGGVEKVLRGGGYDTAVASLRASNRLAADPTERDSNVGFRCARSQP